MGEGVFCCPWAQFVIYLIPYNQADFPPEGGTTVEKTTLPAAGGVLPRGAAAGMQFSDDGEHAGGRASPGAPAFGRLRGFAERPERLAGRERPAQVPHAGRPAFAVPVTGPRRRRGAGCGGSLHHRPVLQCVHCLFAAGRGEPVEGVPEHRGPCGHGGQCSAGPIAGRQLHADGGGLPRLTRGQLSGRLLLRKRAGQRDSGAVL